MKLKMLETVQGAGISGTLLKGDIPVTILAEGEEYEIGEELADWLLEHRKAEPLKEKAVHYGAQVEPEFRQDDEKYKELTAETTETEADFKPLPELTEENATEEKTAEPIMATEKKPKRRRSK